MYAVAYIGIVHAAKIYVPPSACVALVLAAPDSGDHKDGGGWVGVGVGVGRLVMWPLGACAASSECLFSLFGACACHAAQRAVPRPAGPLAHTGPAVWTHAAAPALVLPDLAFDSTTKHNWRFLARG
jgi:hypothetical protein